MASVSNAQALLSVDCVKPIEEGGPISRSGFKYQDEIAVGFLIEMLESPSIVKIHCETHDDVVLIRSDGNSASYQAEFVQVKAGEPDKLWSVADLSSRKGGKVGTSIFETSLARDRHTEESRFRIVTLRPVVEQIKLLTYPYGAPGRESDGPRFKALEAELDTRFPGLKSTKGNGTAYWIEHCLWDQRHSEESVRKDNLVRLWQLGAIEGRPLLPYAAETILEDLRKLAKAAGDAKWEPDRDRKIITREVLRRWWDQRTRDLVEDVIATGQPPLAIHHFPINEATRLHFAARRVPFVGRDAEMAQLDGFMKDSRPFAWWIITGSGGLGKSRLALECCLNLPGCRAGFLPHNHGVQSWHDWQPDRPTLMLIDYAANRPDQVRDIVDALASKQPPLKYPVRLLLLERQSQGRWWDVFLGGGTTRLLIKQSLFADPMALQPISRNAVWETIEFILGRSGHPVPDNREAALASLESLDPERRPLFVALAADALAAGRDIRQWNRLQLLENVLQRERSLFWEPAGVTEADRNLLALATMATGLSLATLNELTDSAGDDFFPNAKNYVPERYATMCGQPATSELPALEPDIIGEFFVLEHVKPHHALDQDRANRLRHLVWRHRRHGAISFLSRAALDFPDHPSLRLLTQPASDDPSQRTAWAFLAGNLIGLYSSNGDIERARAIYDQLATLTKKHDTEVHLVETLAIGAFNLATSYGLAGDLFRAIEFHNSLSDLSTLYPTSLEVHAAWAQSAANLIDDLAKGNHLAEAEDLYDRLGIIEAFADEPILRESLAKGAVNLSVAYGEAGKIEEVEVVYDVVSNLAYHNPNEAALQVSLIKAANNAVLFLGKAKELEKARAVLRDLTIHMNAHTRDRDLRAGFAKAGLNFVKLAVRTKNVKAGTEIREELRALAEHWPDEQNLRSIAAECLPLLVVLHGSAQDFAKAAEICEEAAGLTRLSEPKQLTHHIIYARSLQEFVVAQAAAQAFDEAENTYQRLVELTKTVQCPGIRELCAQAAYSLVSFLSEEQQFWQRAQILYEDLKKIAADFQEETVLREHLAKAAFNFFDQFRKAGRMDLATGLYQALSALALENPREPELLHQSAKAALNLSTSYAADDPDAAEVIYRELEGLTRKHPEDDQIKGARNGCALNLVRAHLLRNDIDRARSFALSVAAILRLPDLRLTIAVMYGKEQAERLFAPIDALLA